MNTAGRRAEIISILMVRRRITAKELAEEFNVTVRTIQNDIQALSLGFPIYTRQGGDGGIFVGDNYKPYMNTLTPLELKVLHEMYGLADGIHKKVLFQLMNDSVFDLENYISQEFARRIGAAEEESFLTGDGNKKPEGVFTKVTATDGALTTINDAKAINQVVQCSDSMLEILKDNMEAVIGEETEKELDSITSKLALQQEALLEATREKKPYEDIADEIENLRDRKQEVLTEKAMQEGRKLRIEEMTTFLNGMSQELTKYDEQMVRKYIEKITVFDNYFEVEFKAGLKIEIEK